MALKWYDYAWPMGGVLSASLFIAWATEVLAFFLSRGLAFAILALLQVLPEFAVEAVITVSAGKDPVNNLQYVTANFTGSNRLIAGLFIPMTFYVAAWRARKRRQRISLIQLPAQSSVEVVFLLIPTLYSVFVAFRGRLTPFDAVFLVIVYLAYLAIQYRMPPAEEEHEGLPLVPRTIRRWTNGRQLTAVAVLFAVGGYLIFHSVEPFYQHTLELGAAIGLSSYFLLQWLAPFLSEFPEFITIAYWSRTGRSALGVTNAISSNINQLTLLIAMLPFAFAYGTGLATGTPQWELAFDHKQRVEILLTSVQMLFATLVLLDLKLDRWQAHLLVGLWLTQLMEPLVDLVAPGMLPSPLGTGLALREWLIFVYGGLCLILVGYHRGRFEAFKQFGTVWKRHIAPRRS